MIGTKLKELRAGKGYTIPQLCEQLDMNPNTYAKYERDERDVSTDTLAKLADYYGISTDYLLGRNPTAEDPIDILARQKRMPSKEKAALAKWLELDAEKRDLALQIMREVILEYEKAAEVSITEKPPIIMIRKHRSKASAGCGYDLNNDDEWKRIQIISSPQSERADFAVEVEGDSMLPDYQNGDLVLIEFDSDVPIGKVGLFRQGDKGYIKERGEDRLISRNPDYPDIYGEVVCIGRVLGVAELPEE